MEQRRLNQNQNLPDPEKRKKIFLWLVVFIAAFSVIFFSVSYLKKSLSKKGKKEAVQTTQIQCNFADDSEAANKAFEENNSDFCACVQGPELKTRCQKFPENKDYINQATAQLNDRICEMIKDDEYLKASCIQSVGYLIENIKKDNPDFLASVYLRNGDYNEAIKIFKDSEKVSSLLGLALSYANKGLFEHKEAEFVPKAQELVEKAKGLEPNNPEVFRVQGFVYEVKSDIPKSIESYDKALELDPGYLLALVGRAHAYSLLGDLNKSLEDYRKAAEVDKEKTNMEIYANLCRLQVFRNDLLEEGVKNCQIVIDMSRGSLETKSETHQILADLYVSENKLDEALEQLKKASILSPQNVNLFISFGNLYLAKKDYQKAAEEGQKALEIDPLKTAAYSVLAVAFVGNKDYELAEKNALKGLEVIDKDPSLLASKKPAYLYNLNYILADIYTARGETEKATQYRKTGDAATKAEK